MLAPCFSRLKVARSYFLKAERLSLSGAFLFFCSLNLRLTIILLYYELDSLTNHNPNFKESTMSGLTIEQGRENDLLDRLAKAVSNSTKHDMASKHSLREAIESIKHPEPPTDKAPTDVHAREREFDRVALAKEIMLTRANHSGSPMFEKDIATAFAYADEFIKQAQVTA